MFWHGTCQVWSKYFGPDQLLAIRAERWVARARLAFVEREWPCGVHFIARAGRAGEGRGVRGEEAAGVG